MSGEADPMGRVLIEVRGERAAQDGKFGVGPRGYILGPDPRFADLRWVLEPDWILQRVDEPRVCRRARMP